jgi:hypothetical protein
VVEFNVLVEVVLSSRIALQEDVAGALPQLVLLVVLELRRGQRALGGALPLPQPLQVVGLQSASGEAVPQPLLLQPADLLLLRCSDLSYLFERQADGNVEVPDGGEVDGLAFGELVDDDLRDLAEGEDAHEVVAARLLAAVVVLGSDELVDLLSQSAHVLLAVGNVLREGRADLHCLLLKLK